MGPTRRGISQHTLRKAAEAKDQAYQRPDACQIRNTTARPELDSFKIAQPDKRVGKRATEAARVVRKRRQKTTAGKDAAERER